MRNLVFLSLAAVAVLAVVLKAIFTRPEDSIRRLAGRDATSHQDIYKRRGGGGGGGHGVGGGGHGVGGGGHGVGGGGHGVSSGGSITGGRTTTGSGPKPGYIGGTYGGGSTVPFQSGKPSGSISPFLIDSGAGQASWPGIWPGIWPHNAYIYPYTRPYVFYNRTSDKNESKAILCACDETQECSCEENANTTAHINELVGNGSYAALDKQVVNVAVVNGTDTILINGTLPNGTTAAGGTEDPNAGAENSLHSTAWWPLVAIVISMVFVV